DPAQSYFGTHISLTPYYIELTRRIGHRKVRLHDTSMIGKWAIAEPEPGQFQFFDEAVTATKNGGLEILGMLDGAPKWASAMPREEGGYWAIWNIPNAPDAPARWENYVRTVVGHYKGRIDRWEIWNEPWGKWFIGSGGPPELYADLMKRAYRVAHEANPQSYIIGVDTYRGHEDTWTEPVLKNANSAYYDGFSFHDYNDAFYGGPEPFPVAQAKVFNDLQRKYGEAKPLWNTEGGIFGVGSFYAPETGGMAAQNQPAYAVRYDVTNMAAGVQAYYVYAIHTDPGMGDHETRLTEFDRAVGPLLAARAVLASFVDGAGMPQRLDAPPGVDDYRYPTGVHVVWSHDGAPHDIPLPQGMKALDVWGNAIEIERAAGEKSGAAVVTVGPEPVYLVK
ncbi:MAG: hypothetical protein M3347_10920, partial [Armatimonadota bacterium]|nr:hypothetical protein [Armatimonadota bacterium]